MPRNCGAYTGAIASSYAFALVPIGSPRVSAPNRPGHAALGQNAHGRPAALRDALKPVFLLPSLLPQLLDRAAARCERAFAFLAVSLVQPRRVLVPYHRPRLVLRARDLQGLCGSFERAQPPFERGFAQIACNRARLRRESVPRHEGQPVVPKPYVETVRCGCFVHLAPTSRATQAFGAFTLDPADQRFDATESLAVRRSTWRWSAVLAIRCTWKVNRRLERTQPALELHFAQIPSHRACTDAHPILSDEGDAVAAQLHIDAMHRGDVVQLHPSPHVLESIRTRASQRFTQLISSL